MGWIAYSLLMFCGSVALYLCVRKSSLTKVPTELTNLAMFAIPLVFYLLIGISTHINFHISASHLIILLIASVVFAFGGNTASLKAIDIAPNPGYSLVLSKSYVLFTTIVSVSLLDAELTFQKAVAILIIVLFSAVIMIDPRKAKHVKNNKWIWLSLGAFFAWGMLSLSSKYLFTHGLDTIAFLIYLYLIVTICIALAGKMKKSTFQNIPLSHWKLLIGTGIFATLFNLGQFRAIRIAPNIGYVNTINASSISLVTIMAVILFKDELTKQKAVGVVGVTLGLILLLI